MSRLAEAAARFADQEIVLVGDECDQTIFLSCPADGIDAARLETLHELGRGMVVLGLPEPVARQLELPAPWNATDGRREVKLTAPIDAAVGIEGGWSLRDRALTMRVASDPGSRSSDIKIPGHVYPALIGERPRNAAAAAIELARLSGRAPGVALCAVVDRHGREASLRDARADEQLRALEVASPAELQSGWLASHADELSVSCALPTTDGIFRAVGYGALDDDAATVALIHGDPAGGETPLVHVHVACLFGDVFGSLLCDCGRQFDRAVSEIAAEGAGVIIYAKPQQPAPAACARGERIDAVVVAGLLRAAGVGRIRLLDDRGESGLREQLRTCGLEVAA